MPFTLWFYIYKSLMHEKLDMVISESELAYPKQMKSNAKNKRASVSEEQSILIWLFPVSPATEGRMWGKVWFLLQASDVAADILSCLRRGSVTHRQSLPGLILAALWKQWAKRQSVASSSKWGVSSFVPLSSCWRWSQQLGQGKNTSQCWLLLLLTPEQRSRAWKSGLNIPEIKH